jgi:DNA-binding response OmpR family regulator
MTKSKILVVDDDPGILNFTRTKLNSSGYEAMTATNGYECIDCLRMEKVDLVVLDLIMPRMEGLECLARIRAFSSIPVIILSARGSDEARIKGLKLGADDYLPKPFNPDELVARIETVLRRLDRLSVQRIKSVVIKDITVDFESHSVNKAGRDIQLTRIEWLLLSHLAANAGRLITQRELLARIWGPEYVDDLQILRTWMSRLRRKLGHAGNSTFIRTVAKSGYIIDNG